MSKAQGSAISGKTFEKIKRINAHGAEYWSARDLQTLLGYTQWRHFEQAIQRALGSCYESGNPTDNHFAGAGKMVSIGSGSERELEDVHLSRFACYLIAQNGDPRKPEIALAQQYFAIQTRRQELNEQAAADKERLELRKQATQEFKALSSAAQCAGVQSRMFGVFHDAGYKGMYNGMGGDAIKARKGIDPREQLMDLMNATEKRLRSEFKNKPSNWHCAAYRSKVSNANDGDEPKRLSIGWRASPLACRPCLASR